MDVTAKMLAVVGLVERRRTMAKGSLAEREGFEPPIGLAPMPHFRVRCIRPLCHLSKPLIQSSTARPGRRSRLIFATGLARYARAASLRRFEMSRQCAAAMTLRKISSACYAVMFDGPNPATSRINATGVRENDSMHSATLDAGITATISLSSASVKGASSQ